MQYWQKKILISNTNKDMKFKYISTVGSLIFCCITEMSGVAFLLLQINTSNYFQDIGAQLFLSMSWVTGLGLLVAIFTVKKIF